MSFFEFIKDKIEDLIIVILMSIIIVTIGLLGLIKKISRSL